MARRLAHGASSDRRLAGRPSLLAPAGDALISLEIILGIVFGSGDDELAREIFRVFSEEIYQDLGSWSAWTRFVRYQPRLPRADRRADRARRRRGPGPGGDTLFDAMVQARDEAGELAER